MLHGNYKRFPEHVREVRKDLKILKNTAIYGGNSAGKTNFVIALETLRDIIVDGTNNIKENLPYTPFKLCNKKKEDTIFEIDFLIDEIDYTYFISYNKEFISEESLYKSSSSDNPIEIFTRKTNPKSLNSTITIHKSLVKKDEEKIRIKIYEEDLRQNQPFINLAFNKKIEIISDAYNWFDHKLSFIFIESKYRGLPQRFNSDKTFKNKYIEILKSLNLGIDDITVKETKFDDFFGSDPEHDEFKNDLNKHISEDEGVEFEHGTKNYYAYINEDKVSVVGYLMFLHKNRHGDYIEFNYEEESRGTKRILELIPAIINSTKKNMIYVVDEIESSIHPLLIKSLIKLFFKANKNSNSQLIFTTHESNLLDLNIMRQDEIWFFEKSKDLSTNIYSLSDFKARHDLDVNKAYLEGKYGSIPYLKSIENIL
jgi:hypothetical protein